MIFEEKNKKKPKHTDDVDAKKEKNKIILFKKET